MNIFLKYHSFLKLWPKSYITFWAILVVWKVCYVYTVSLFSNFGKQAHYDSYLQRSDA